MWPSQKLKNIAEDAAARLDASVGTLTSLLSLMAAGIVLCLVGVALLLVRGA